MNSFIDREEIFDAALRKELRHSLFVLSARINGIPALKGILNCEVTFSRCHNSNRSAGHSPFTDGPIQLRPVTYRGICDLTQLELITYSKTRPTSAQ